MPQASSKLKLPVNLAIFFFGAIALVAPSGYSWGPALLLLMALPQLVLPSYWKRLERQDFLIVVALAVYTLAAIIEVSYHQIGTRELDRPSRFLAAILVLPLLLTCTLKPSYLWTGISLGGFSAGIYAVWQVVDMGINRAGGNTQIIQFGNICMLLSLLSLSGNGWAGKQTNPKLWCGLLALGFLGGAAGSVLSGSRGSWVAFLVGILIVFWGFRDRLNLKAASALTVTLGVIVAVAWFTPQSSLQTRTAQAFDDFATYANGEHAHTSVGSRLEMWEAAMIIGAEKPLLGWGKFGYEVRKAEYIKQGRFSDYLASYTHAHNEFFDAWSKRGAFGLIALVLLFLLPTIAFCKGFSEINPATRSFAVAGAIVPGACAVFSMSQGFFSHNSGSMVYAFMTVILWAFFQQSRMADHTETSQPKPR
jgi:O-antigen ligase